MPDADVIDLDAIRAGLLAWVPPAVPPNDRTNETAQLDAHPSDHNAISDALTSINAQVLALTNAPPPAGGLPIFASVAERTAAFPAPSAGAACYMRPGDKTDGIWTFSGVDWRPVSWNAPWGLIGFTFRNGDLALAAGTPVFWPQTIAFTGIVRRQYRLDSSVRIQQGGAVGDQVVSITDGAGTVLATSQIGVSGTTSYATHRAGDVLPFVGPITLQMKLTASSAATNRATVTSRNWMGVWDDGPAAGAPA